ncbi:hypothetical protein NIES4071_53500 [Calothrix sp. NIES-4071]|nr:hypothetical protein NIES4071_53500 [Calothrix sp. NIES-4071]BAZ59658.1 hypothetical protein NIES4105_53450 [Calothrix sp. NIES-4105]
MASIKISLLRPAGFDLFEDSESFLNDLSNKETETVVGGAALTEIISYAVAYTYIIDTPAVKNVETQFVQTEVTVSVGVGLQTYSVLSPA